MFLISDAAARSASGKFSPGSGSYDEGSIEGARLPKYLFERMGPDPAESLLAMVDYGLNDDEIGRYYGITSTTIRHFRSMFGITDAD